MDLIHALYFLSKAISNYFYIKKTKQIVIRKNMPCLWMFYDGLK